MSKGFKNSVIVVLLVTLMSTMVFFSPTTYVSADTSVGLCGENATWTWDSITGELKITGTGEIRNGGWVNTHPKSVVISEGITSIAAGTFADNYSITEIQLPVSLKTVGASAFGRCRSLTYIDLHVGITKIENSAFSGCTALEEISIPGSVNTLGDEVFNDCTALKKIYIPGSVTYIGDDAFRNCYALNEIDVNEGNKYYTDMNGILYNKDMNILLKFPSASAVEELNIPETVELVADGAIHHCYSLSKIVIPEGTSIYRGYDVTANLKDCPKLTSLGGIGSGESIEIGWTETIPEETFANCTTLEKIIIPEGIKKIEKNAFSNSNNLTSIKLPASVEVVENSLPRSEKLTSAGPTGSSADIEFGWTEKIPDNAFYGHSALTSVNLPKSISVIGKYAFYGCSKLEEIILPDSLTSMGENAFYKCTKLKSVTIPEGMNTISRSAFGESKNIESVVIPLGVKKINDYAFYGCTALTDVYYAGSESDWEYISVGYDNEPLLNATIHYDYIGDTSEVYGDFYCGKKHFSGKYGFYYKDSYFENASTIYNHNLATMSLCLAFCSYGTGDFANYDKNVKSVLNRCGFSNEYPYKAFDYNEEPTAHSVACAIGAKTINEDETLIAVAVRSGGYEAEWDSNLTVGKSSDHEGFDNSAEIVEDYIRSYIVENQIKGDIKIWITGFSRGAAVATQTAAKLNVNNNYEYPDRDGNYVNISYDKEDVYAYGFATPAGAHISSDPNGGDYSNIFNVIEYNDVVPLVAPAKWNFTRYGTTFILPYREGNDPATFNKYISKIKARMGSDYKVDDMSVTYAKGNMNFETATLGTYNREVVNTLARHIGSRENYCSKYDSMLSSTIGKLVSDKTNEIDFVDVIVELVGIVPWGNFLSGGIIATVPENAVSMVETHYNPEYYVSWMQLMDANYENSLPVVWGGKNYRNVVINGAADVNVYDSADTLVASIVDRVPQNVEGSTIFAGVNDSSNMTIYLPADSAYQVEISAAESGKVSYSVQEYNSESGDCTRVVNYSFVDMEANEKLTSVIDSFDGTELENGADSGSSVEYTLEKDSEEIKATADISGIDEIENRTYSITVDCDSSKGAVTGTGSYIEGTTVALTAENKPGYEFQGFYLNGLPVDDNDGNKYTYIFAAAGNEEYAAVYDKCSHGLWGEIVTDSQATLNDNGSAHRQCEVCGFIDPSTIYHPKTFKLSAASFTYNGNVRKPQVTVIDSKGNKISAKNYNITYAAGRKNVGTYKVTVKFKGDYAGTKTLSFKINPKGTSISTLTAAKKGFTAKWKKQTAKMASTRITGYEVRYSTYSSFKSYSTKLVKGYSVTSKKISGLKSNKTYYVKVRTYKTVNGQKYYSPWSTVKKVKTK